MSPEVSCSSELVLFIESDYFTFVPLVGLSSGLVLLLVCSKKSTMDLRPKQQFASSPYSAQKSFDTSYSVAVLLCVASVHLLV